MAQRIARLAKPGTIIGLDGGLGAGKTQFSRYFAKALGVKENITSPTFSLVNEYLGSLPLFHMDLYRISSEEEFENMGGYEYFDGNGVCLVEWSVRLGASFPAQAWHLSIEVQNTLRIFYCKGIVL